MNHCKIIAVCNQKGGVGKTTTTVNLGVGLARAGKRVLLVDADPQGDLTTCLGWQDSDNLPITIADLLYHAIMEQEVNARDALLRHAENVSLLPANIDLSGMEMQLVTAMSREYALRTILDPLRKQYDYILIDCMPSLGMITINALAAADSVVIPVQAHYLSAKGMTQLIRTIEKVKKQINPSLKIDGAVLTLADMRTNLARATANIITSSYGHVMRVYKTIVPVSTKAAEMSAQGKSIFAYDANGKAAAAYEQLTKEVLQHGEKQRAQSKAAQCR